MEGGVAPNGGQEIDGLHPKGPSLPAVFAKSVAADNRGFYITDDLSYPDAMH